MSARRPRLVPAVCLALLSGTTQALAQEDPAELPPPPPPENVPVAGAAQELVSESARVPVRPPEVDLVRFALHGELQLRAAALSKLRLRRADGSFDDLGQQKRAYHWLRLTPRLQLEETFEIVAQADAPSGTFASDEPRAVETFDEPYAASQPFELDPRWLFVEYRSSGVALRGGQQPFHHGMGLVENDGNHAPLFGDYQGGDRFERLQLLYGPKGSKFALLAAVDLVFADENARLTEGDLALRGTLGMRYSERYGTLGLIGIVRHQTKDEGGDGQEFNTVLLDSAGSFRSEVKGGGALLFGDYEFALRFGDENIGRALTGPVDDDDLSISAWAAALKVGSAFPSGRGAHAFGRFVGAVEWGYASGDGAPHDTRVQSFAFDPNHKIGLVLFDEVLRWKSARASRLVGQAPSRAFNVASAGSVSAATYLNPTFVYRPLRSLDLKAGLVIAQATDDVVDPSSFSPSGVETNYDGGPSSARDLGIELDAGFEWRAELNTDLNLELGAQAGILFPGHAFDSASGDSLAPQRIGVARVGVQY